MPDVARAAGLLAGMVADRLLGDPRRFHPVAGFGQAAGLLERRMYADSRSRGLAFVAATVLPALVAGLLIDRRSRAHPMLRATATAAATWTVLGGRSLAREAHTITDQLAVGDLAAARQQLTHLVGRDTSNLDEAEIARAAVESVAENTSDAVVAPLLWGGASGIAGLLAYRAINTLDAMVGRRSPRYRNFGWAAARLDDLVNLVPARIAAVLAAAAAPIVGGTPAGAVRTARRDGRRHPSPNAGPVEAAFAGALGVRLGGINVYDGDVEDRGTLGDGPPVGPTDLPRATRLAAAVGWGATGLAAAVSVGRSWTAGARDLQR